MNIAMIGGIVGAALGCGGLLAFYFFLKKHRVSESNETAIGESLNSVVCNYGDVVLQNSSVNDKIEETSSDSSRKVELLF
jgi:hypothetical protein